VHVHAGLAHETQPYRRAQLLLWGARANEQADPTLAARWYGELDALRGDGVDDLRARGLSQRGTTQRRRATTRITAALGRNGGKVGKTRRPHTNLQLVDAY
jgi:hypothetical protein